MITIYFKLYYKYMQSFGHKSEWKRTTINLNIINNNNNNNNNISVYAINCHLRIPAILHTLRIIFCFRYVIVNTRIKVNTKNCYNNTNLRWVLAEHLQFLNQSLLCPHFLHQQAYQRPQQSSKSNCSYEHLETDETWPRTALLLL
jgi:hypothetical protein